MKTAKTTTFSLIIVNLDNKDILQFLFTVSGLMLYEKIDS